MCADADISGAERIAGELAAHGVGVQVEPGLGEPERLWSVLTQPPGPRVVAFMVSAAFDRRVARPWIDMVSRGLGGSQRLLVMDLRYFPSLSRQCKAVAGALEGLRRTTTIERGFVGSLTSSASRGSVASGAVETSSATARGSMPLRVVHPPVLLASPLHTVAEVVPAGARFRVSNPAGRMPSQTRPDVDAAGLSQTWR